MPCMAHCRWTHEIDNKDQEIIDEGDMFLLQNGECMEIGQMMNPNTQRVDMYKEYWTSVAVGESDSIHGTPRCVVARTKGDDSTRGMIIRLGGYCQGVVRFQDEKTGETFQIGRWEGIKNSRGTLEWRKDPMSSTMTETHLPAAWLCEDEREVGDECTTHSQGATVAWFVTEA